MAIAIDMSGRRCGRLTVIERVRSAKAQAQWKCRCDCWKEVVVCGQSLRNGHTQSCGCYGLEVSASHTPSNSRHKESGTRLYGIWKGLRSRCKSEGNTSFGYYGGRGIKVCPEWDESYEAFRDWALANGYRDDLTIDREDTNGNYTPENCRWASRKTQMNNTRANRRLAVGGKEKTVAEWAEDTGIAYSTVRDRALRGDAGKELLRPPHKRREKCGNKDETAAG